MNFVAIPLVFIFYFHFLKVWQVFKTQALRKDNQVQKFASTHRLHVKGLLSLSISSQYPCVHTPSIAMCMVFSVCMNNNERNHTHFNGPKKRVCTKTNRKKKHTCQVKFQMYSFLFLFLLSDPFSIATFKIKPNTTENTKNVTCIIATWL
jgi:hypothetical protein